MKSVAFCTTMRRATRCHSVASPCSISLTFRSAATHGAIAQEGNGVSPSSERADSNAEFETWRTSIRSLLRFRQVFYVPQQTLQEQLRVHVHNGSVRPVDVIRADCASSTTAAEGTQRICARFAEMFPIARARSDKQLLLSATINALLSCLRFADSAHVGDLPLFFAGKCQKENLMNDDLWVDTLTAVALLKVSAQMFDHWVEQCFEFYSVPQPSESSPSAGEPSPSDTALHPLPFHAAFAMVAYASGTRDVERAVKLYHRCRTHGIAFPGDSDAQIDAKLQLLASVMASARRTHFDGGVRNMFLKELQSTIPGRALIRRANWGTINDVLSAVDFPAAMKLVAKCSAARGGDGAVPFFVWASLLRRAARQRLITEAESLFLFIRKRFDLQPAEMSELVEVMMRMYSATSYPDTATTISTFLQHLVENATTAQKRHSGPQPTSSQELKPNSEHYKLLIRSSESRNTASMLFLEACSDGVALDQATFSALFERNPKSSVAQLHRRLPHGYRSSSLDQGIHLPADSDAHLRREEALRLREKPLVDSTEEAR